MVRTQIQLSEEQARELKRLAAERSVSVAEVIRGAVDRELREDDRAARWERARSHFGKYSSGVGDIAERHDEYLADAFEH
ncbi:MAG TPA: CopG family transcriptional regulator [Gaiellaceae bacterium]|jgi:hypothetical protein|nr:CopG family transcriptional regulator [Gaiellaceae bacterium]